MYLSGVAAFNDLGSGTITNANVTTNPHFVDVSTNNFHLQASSTNCIGLGEDLSGVLPTDTDFDEIVRTAPWDVGAFKYITSGGGSGKHLTCTPRG